MTFFFSFLTGRYVSFLLVFTLPIDIASTYYNQCVIDSKPFIPTVVPNRTLSPVSNLSILSTTVSSVSSSPSPPSHSIPNYDDLSSLTISSPPASDVKTDDELTTFSPSDSTAVPSTIDCSKPWIYSPEKTLRNIFRLVYWTSQLLTWIVLPLMQVCSP